MNASLHQVETDIDVVVDEIAVQAHRNPLELRWIWWARMALESHTIARKLRGGPDSGRFVLLGEQMETKMFVFVALGPEMTMQEACDALTARGISEDDALKLVAEAVAD